MDTLSTQQKLIRLFDAGLSEALIVEETGIPQPTINRIKRGLQEPRETYVRLIDACFFRLMPDLNATSAPAEAERRTAKDRRVGVSDRRRSTRRAAGQ
ncbi:hypothetical protein JCM19000A_32640 [Silvimonas sp. JCM 19000]